jgi:hypothetical protein
MSWKDKAQPLVSRRSAKAQEKLRLVLRDGEKFWRYIYGDPPLWHDPDALAAYLERFSTDSEDQKIKQGWITAIVPMHAVLRGVVLPYVMGGEARWFNELREGAKSLEVGRNELYARVAQAAWQRCDAKAAFYRGLDDAFWARCGWVETDLDDRIDLPRHVWRDARDVLVDAETRSPDHRDMRWMGVKSFLPLETAQWLAKEQWDAKGYDFKPVEFTSDDDDSLREGTEVVPGARSSDTSAAIDSATDFVRILRVFVKGENPNTMSARLSKRDMDDPAGHDDMYDGKDHVLILEACGGYGLADGYKIVGRMEWPYPCDPGETPLTPIKLTRDNRDFYPYPITQPAHPLQVVTNVALSAYYTDMRNSARRVFGVQPEAFQDEAEARALIEADPDDALIGVLLKKGYSIDQAIQIKNMGLPNASLNVGQEMGRELYRLISGLQSFEVEVRANQTAFNTAIQNTQSQLKLQDITEMPDWAAKTAQRKALMCARANLNYEEIKRWVIPPEGVNEDGQPFEREENTSGGGTIIVSDLWPAKPDWQDIRDEIEVDLQPRSMRFKNPDQQAAEIKEIADYQTQMVRIAGDTLKGGNASGARAVLKLMNNSVRLMCKLKNILHWQELMVDPDEIGPPDAPPLDPNAVLKAETERAAITAQQQGAATKLQQQGIPAEGIPAAVGGAA